MTLHLPLVSCVETAYHIILLCNAERTRGGQKTKEESWGKTERIYQS